METIEEFEIQRLKRKRYHIHYLKELRQGDEGFPTFVDAKSTLEEAISHIAAVALYIGEKEDHFVIDDSFDTG